MWLRLNRLKTITGTFEDITLEIVPESPPLEEHERSVISPNYPTVLGYVHIYLDGKNRTKKVPSAYVMFLIDHLLGKFEQLLQGEVVIAEWVSDPWQFELTPLVEQNRLKITLHVPNKWVALQNVDIPLSQFYAEVIHAAEQWKMYLAQHYGDEIENPDKNRDYQKYEQFIEIAKNVLQEYISL
ncbi:MAG: hypothetical protein AAF639_21295 [Chloroflexota bacterium]